MGDGTELGRVRGLGSAHEGAHHWWRQRLTAGSNLFFLAWFMISLTRLGGAEQKAIPGDAQFGAFHGKDFGCHAQFKGIDAIVDDGGDGVHGCFLLVRVCSAPSRAKLCMARL